MKMLIKVLLFDLKLIVRLSKQARHRNNCVNIYIHSGCFDLKRRKPFGRKTFFKKMEKKRQVPMENSEEKAERATEKGENTKPVRL